jgi:acyl carrier protein
VPIGHPIANTRCYVLDRWGEPVAIGAPGALFIAGAGVAPGYVGRPELTAERFSPDPFAGDGVMYDTGDLARWLPDGTLEYLGRADEQVKIRGFRVEPGEVEAALRAHPAIREVAVVVRDDAHGHPRLVAYCAHGPELSQAEMASHTAGLVPDYMIPAVFVSLDALPLTPSGKVDARALPDPAEPGADGDGWVEPSTPLERAVAALWSDVLGIERIGADDDFFALGGHSLLAAQVVAQVRTDFAVELPMHSLFTMPTVATLSEEIGRLLESGDQDETARLLASVEGMSDEEVERMLAEQSSPDDG